MKNNLAIKIGNRLIGDGQPVFVIAEIGINHGGDFDQALRMIDVAVEAGVDAVKFQAFKARKMYSETAGYLNYASKKKSILDIVEEMEMPEEWPAKLAKYAAKKKVIFFSSVCDETSVDLMDQYMPVFKVTSYEMTHIPLLKYIAAKGKAIIMSTGTANLDEVKESVEAIYATGNKQLIIMQCTGKYPAPLSSINARAIVTLKNEFGVPVGLSDHSRDPITAPMTAVALGANLIEKHITLSRRLPGPDQAMAIEPHELVEMVRRIREVEETLGTGEKITQKEEEYVKKFARRSIFATKVINKGDVVTAENAAVLRSGEMKGILRPSDWEKLLGKRAAKAIKTNQALAFSDFK